MCVQHLQQLGTGSLIAGHRHTISDRLWERERGAAPCRSSPPGAIAARPATT
jgi:hypothetical protein